MDHTATDDLPSNFAARMRLYDLDAKALRLLKAEAPFLQAALEAGLKTFLAKERENPAVADLFRTEGENINRLERDHLRLVLSGQFDAEYVVSSRRLSARLDRLGVYARTRLFAANQVERAVLDAARRRWRFSTGRAVALTQVVRSVLDFDVAITMTVQQDASLRASEERREAVEGAIGAFEPAIGEMVEALKRAAGALGRASTELEEATGETSRRMTSASASAADVAANIEDTAAATEQLAASIAEIGQQSEDSLRLAQSAAADARFSMASLDELASAAHQIGSVVELISSVAAQTNLLALNATIEAARAGEAGRGFAVVAAEVKTLAGQTGRATDEISRHIAAIQNATRRSVGQIGDVASLVERIATAATAIAASVEEQGAATRSISEGVRRVAATTSGASEDVRAVEAAGNRSLAATEEIVGWTQRLSAGAGEMERGVAQFFERVRRTG